MAGVITLALGAITVVGGFTFNWVTSFGTGGANIGAGLLVLAGLALAFAGVVLCLTSVLITVVERHHKGLSEK